MSNIQHIEVCPVCSGQHFTEVWSTQDWLSSQERFVIMACDHCSFRFTQDAPSAEHIAPYYDTEDYIEHSDKRSGLVNQLYHFGRKIMMNQKFQLMKKTSSGKRLLDVGSASGYFMDHMKRNGYAVEGVEVSPKARELCKKNFGIDVYEPSWLIDESNTTEYDLISLWHVFEHVYEYDDYFKAFDRLLASNGRLVIAMPNYRSYDAHYYGKYWNAYDVPRHLWHFDPESFGAFAKKRGFVVEQQHAMPLDPFYNAMVSAEYKPGFSFLPWTLLVGGWAYLKGLVNTDKASSIIYILKKNN